MASFKNNGKLKLLIIVGTRPEIIRLSRVLEMPHWCFGMAKTVISGTMHRI